MRLPILVATLLLAAHIACAQGVPPLVNYQGRVAVGTVNFDGTGQFKFALVNSTGTSTYWSNDGSSSAGTEPATAVSLTVAKGLYSVLLGDTTIANMTAISASVWSNADVRLRVWFNDGTNGSQLLTPDQRLAPNGYLPDASVTTAKMADGSVSSAKIAVGGVSSINLAAGAVAPSVSVSSLTQVATSNTSYTAASSSPTTFFLPATADVGDTVHVSGSGTGVAC